VEDERISPPPQNFSNIIQQAKEIQETIEEIEKN
jgi:hypothetical protein